MKLPEYGTKEWYDVALKQSQLKKRALLNALENVARTNVGELDFIEYLAEQVIDVNREIKWALQEIERLSKEN